MEPPSASVSGTCIFTGITPHWSPRQCPNCYTFKVGLNPWHQTKHLTPRTTAVTPFHHWGRCSLFLLAQITLSLTFQHRAGATQHSHILSFQPQCPCACGTAACQASPAWHPPPLHVVFCTCHTYAGYPSPKLRIFCWCSNEGFPAP